MNILTKKYNKKFLNAISFSSSKSPLSAFCKVFGSNSPDKYFEKKKMISENTQRTLKNINFFYN